MFSRVTGQQTYHTPCPQGTPTFAAARRQRRDLIIANPVEANTPTVAGQAVASASAPVNAGTVLLTDSDDRCTPPASTHRQIRTCPPRAKGPLDRRSKWFSLVTFFLQKKKVTRAGSTKRPIPRPQAQHLFAAARAFPHVTGVFLIVVVPPTVPAQLSAAAACYYGKNYSFCRVAG